MMCDQNSCAIKIAKSRWSSTHKVVLSCSDVFNLGQQKQGILRKTSSGKSLSVLVKTASALTFDHDNIPESLYLQSLSAVNLASIFGLAWLKGIKSLCLCISLHYVSEKKDKVSF